MASAQDFSSYGFNDPFGYQPYTGSFGDLGKNSVSTGNSIWGKTAQLFGFGDSQAEYENWKTERDRLYEREATNSARAWDEYMQSTYYQRMVDDLKKAGLNPWLSINSGIGQTNNVNTAGSGSSARSKSEKSEDTIKEMAGLFSMVAKIIALLGSAG